MREKLRTRWEQSVLKAWADGKLRLSRGKKLVLNLVIAALAGLWLWGRFSFCVMIFYGHCGMFLHIPGK